jgi:hypothetical protein
MLAADEYHHYSTGNDWGMALRKLVDLTIFAIATSATPDRDKEPTIFGKPLIEVRYKEGVTEKAVKEIRLHSFHYLIVVEDVAQNKTIELTTAQLREEAGTDEIDVWMQKRNLRFHHDYFNPVLRRALEELFENDRIHLHPAAQLLVRAFSCNHAEYLCNQIKALGFNLSCDWVGTGYNGRVDQINEKVIQQFCPPKDKNGNRPLPTLDILVQCGMAGEGFDSILVSQLVDLSVVRLEGVANQTKQFILRGARWIRGGAALDQVCRLNVGTDHPILKIPNLDVMEWLDSNKDFAANNNPGIPAGPPPPSHPQPINLTALKSFANLKKVQLLSVTPDDPRAEHVMTELRKACKDPDFFSWDNPVAVKQLTEILNQWDQRKHAGRDERAKQDYYRMEINTIVNKVVNQIVRRSSLDFKKDTGRISQLVNRKVAEICGNWRGEATSAQLEPALDYIANLFNEILAGTIPPWVQ